MKFDKQKATIVKLILSWRIMLLLVLFFAVSFFSYRPKQAFTSIIQPNLSSWPISDPVISSWANFDGVHYIAIAKRGYVSEARFFPLYPIILKTVSYPVVTLFENYPAENSILIVGLLLNLVFTTAVSILLILYVRERYDSSLAFLTVLLFISYPTSFFLVSLYSESLFLLLVLLGFKFAKEKKAYQLIAVLTLLSITRLPGILMTIPLLYLFFKGDFDTAGIIKEYVSAVKKILQKNTFFIATTLFVVPSLLVLYSWYNYIEWSNPLYFLTAHGELGNDRSVLGISNPLVIPVRYVKILLTVSPSLYEYWVSVLELGSLVVATLMAWLGKKILKKEEILYVLTVIALPLLSGTLTGFPRYLLLAFPLWIGLAHWVRDKPKTKFTILVLGFILQVVLTSLFGLRYFVA